MKKYCLNNVPIFRNENLSNEMAFLSLSDEVSLIQIYKAVLIFIQRVIYPDFYRWSNPICAHANLNNMHPEHIASHHIKKGYEIQFYPSVLFIFKD